MSAGKKNQELDFSSFPPGTVTEFTTAVCLACTFDIFTKQLGMAPRKAYGEIRDYSPTIAELTSRKAARPFFDSDEKNPHCPYCNAAKRWHSRLDTYCVEGTKVGDAARRSFLKQLPKKDEKFKVFQIRSDRSAAFFDWLDTLRVKLDLDDDGWLLQSARALLERREPKTAWNEVFADIRTIRKSNRLDEGWEQAGARLFLSPSLYNQVLVVQYLLSRSHKHGGRTFDGRLTLNELVRRLRSGGYLKGQGIEEGDQYEVLEKVIEQLSGTGSVTLYYVLDRRDFLEKTKEIYARYR